MSKNTNLSLHSNNKTQRNSNLELFRIISMLLIIAHHYVVNSGLIQIIFDDPKTIKSVSLLVFGMWGKTGINCFLMITGYYMCKSKITIEKFLKLFFEVVFYNLIFYFVFIAFGYQEFNYKYFIFRAFPINNVTDNFTSCFLLFYLFIPYLNILIQNINKRQHLYLIGLCLFIYSILPMFYIVYQNYVIWFSIIYLIASYIRFYQLPQFNNTRLWGLITLFFFTLSILTVVIWAYIGKYPYIFVFDSYLLLPTAVAVSSFMFFKNLKIKYNKWINIMGASTFGVLLIHANSDTMREWLWVRLLKNTDAYNTDHLLFHSIISVLLIFLICSFLDRLRFNILEKPLFKKINPFIKILTKRLTIN